MGDLAKREQVRNFRKWVGDNLPKDQAERVWQLLESLVFISNPNLAGTLFYETRTGAGSPQSADYPKDGLGLYIDSSTGSFYVVLKWQGSFYSILGGSGDDSGRPSGNYLPLTAGHQYPLTGDLYLTLATAEPADLILGKGEAVFWYEARP